MARKLRLEFPGALCHIINRGNYRRWIFDAASTRTAFETCRFAGCERSGWLLHAFVRMGNHYHLAVETAEGDLVAGMQWLQAIFANRFNRLRLVNGHSGMPLRARSLDPLRDPFDDPLDGTGTARSRKYWSAADTGVRTGTATVLTDPPLAGAPLSFSLNGAGTVAIGIVIAFPSAMTSNFSDLAS
jgi:REP element-mobilizing transposase RayT